MTGKLSRRSFVGLSVAMMAVPLLGACGDSGPSTDTGGTGDDWERPDAADLESYVDALHKAAQAEGTVVWYTSAQASAGEAMKAAFEKRFPGVTVLLFRATVPQVLQKLTQENSAGVYTCDVLALSSPGQSPQFREEGLVTPYKIFEYDVYPESVRGDAELFELVDKYTAFSPIVYNTNQMSRDEVPTSLRALSELDPAKNSGKIIYTDPRNYPFLLHYVHWVQSAGREMPQKLRGLNPTVVEGGSQLVQGIVSGEYAMCPAFNMQAFVDLKATTPDAPVDFVIPEEGLWMQPGSHLVVNQAPHPNAARLFLEYVFSAEGQVEWAAPGFVPTRPGVPLPPGLEWVETAKVDPIDFEAVFADQEKWVAEATEDLGL